MKTLVFTVVCTLWFAGCVSSGPTEENRLIAELTSAQAAYDSIKDVVIKAKLTNHGPTNAAIDTFVLASPVLAVRLLDSKGRVMPPGPPPTPPSPEKANDYLKVLKSGDSRTFTYQMNVYFVDFPAGEYTAKMTTIDSPSVKFSIRQNAKRQPEPPAGGDGKPAPQP